jgi:hypothetical protein
MWLPPLSEQVRPMNTTTPCRGTQLKSTPSTRLATLAAATLLTSLTLCTPADAHPVLPPGATADTTSNPTPPEDSGAAWQKLAVDAGGAAAVIGIGVAAARLRRRTTHVSHPG